MWVIARIWQWWTSRTQRSSWLICASSSTWVWQGGGRGALTLHHQAAHLWASSGMSGWHPCPNPERPYDGDWWTRTRREWRQNNNKTAWEMGRQQHTIHNVVGSYLRPIFSLTSGACCRLETPQWRSSEAPGICACCRWTAVIVRHPSQSWSSCTVTMTSNRLVLREGNQYSGNKIDHKGHTVWDRAVAGVYRGRRGTYRLVGEWRTDRCHDIRQCCEQTRSRLPYCLCLWLVYGLCTLWCDLSLAEIFSGGTWRLVGLDK